jgi:hypothetical protein
MSAVFLEDADQHPRERSRFELTSDAVAADGVEVVRVESAGENRTARLLWTVMLGDLVSLGLAERRGVDPLPVEAIELQGGARPRLIDPIDLPLCAR